MGKIGDIWVRLGVKTDDFKKGISDAKREAQGLNSSMGKMSGAVGAAGGALKGLAGAAGVALGAMETFDRLIKSNEANNDKWENTVRAMNNSVSEFFSALSSGDFSLFNDGLDSIIQKARDTADALRQIEDTQTMFGYFGGKNNLEFAKQLNILRDKSASDDQRLAAKSEAEKLIAEQESLVNVYRQRADNAVARIITQRSDIDASEVQKADVERMMGVILDASFEDKDEAYVESYKEYESRINELQKLLTGAESRSRMTMSATDLLDVEKYKRQIEALRAEYFDARLYNALWNKTNGDDLKMISGLYQGSDAAARGVEGMRSRLLRYSTTLSEGPEEGSIAWYEDQIANLKTLVDNTTDQSVRTAAQSSINAYEKELAALKASLPGGDAPGTGGKASELPAQKGSLAYYKQELQKAQTDVDNAVGEVARAQAQATVNAIEEKIQAMDIRNDTLTALEDGTYVEDFLGDIDIPDEEYKFNDKIDLKPTDIDVPELSSGMEDYTRNIYEASNAIGVLGGAMSNITGLVDSGAASWTSYGTNIIQAIAQAIPAIASLTAAKSAEATANAASAATGAGSAVAGIPFVGPAMAVAAIASVIAALANVPKFAEGGVVGGSSYYGDRILARLNSGELVLNQSQQAGLLNMIDRPTQNIHLDGAFSISGRDLRLVLDKYDYYRRQ